MSIPVHQQIEGTSFGTFDVLFAALNNYGFKFHQIEWIQEAFADDISDDERKAWEEMREALAIFSPAREHIMTLYFQWELINLTQNLFYLTVPAMFIAGTMVGVVKPSHFPGTILGIPNILWAFGIAFTLQRSSSDNLISFPTSQLYGGGPRALPTSRIIY